MYQARFVGGPFHDTWRECPEPYEICEVGLKRATPEEIEEWKRFGKMPFAVAVYQLRHLDRCTKRAVYVLNRWEE